MRLWEIWALSLQGNRSRSEQPIFQFLFCDQRFYASKNKPRASGKIQSSGMQAELQRRNNILPKQTLYEVSLSLHAFDKVQPPSLTIQESRGKSHHLEWRLIFVYAFLLKSCFPLHAISQKRYSHRLVVRKISSIRFSFSGFWPEANVLSRALHQSAISANSGEA